MLKPCLSASALTLALACTPVLLSAATDAPTTNPILSFYGEDAYADDYAWTVELPWSNVFDIRDYGGVADGNDVGDGVGVTDNTAAFHAAVDAAYAAGGGVVYIPEGVWYFADSINIKSGVVVRGAAPADITSAHDDGFAPPTRLEFPKYFFDPSANDGAGISNDTAFKSIGVEENGNANNIGFVWLDINRASIRISADGLGTHNRVVFGVRNNNVAIPDPGVPELTRDVDGVGKDFQKPWQRFSYRFGRNIQVYGIENILVANNRVNDKHYLVEHNLPGADPDSIDDFVQPGYVVQDTKRVFTSDGKSFVELQAEHRPIFRYTDHYGIYVRGGSGDVWGAAPWETPGLFRPGITVRDNFVYSTMRVGYHLSGYGLKVLNNIKKDISGKDWWLHPTGRTTVSGAQTLENRGMDIGGSQILVDGNEFQVFRHQINGGKYQSTDGEGILVQECCGGTILDDIVITNNVVNAYIGIYKMPYTRNITISGNEVSGQGYIMVNANKNGTQAPVFDITVENNTFLNGNDILITGNSGGGGVVVRNNTLNGGNINYPDPITTLEGNTGYGALNPEPVGTVRDYPLLVLEDPSVNGVVEENVETTLRARVPGSYLVPAPQSANELPDVVSVEIYVNTQLVASFNTNTLDPDSIAWIYETPWTPAPGFYQLAAKATPAGYNGPTNSTAWFTISNVVFVSAEAPDAGPTVYEQWLAFYFGEETDPAIIGDQADWDLDGMPNVLEFAIGADPQVADAHLQPALYRGENSITFVFPLRDDLGSDVSFGLMQSHDLQSWTPVEAAELTPIADDGTLPSGVTLHEYVVEAAPDAEIFLRLSVTR